MTLEPDARIVVGVSAEVGAGAPLSALLFLEDLAARLGGPSPRMDVELHLFGCAPAPAWFGSFLRSGTCRAGWCSASDRSERRERTLEVVVGLRQRLDGDWTVVPLSPATRARLSLGEGGAPAVAVVWTDDDLPRQVREVAHRGAWTPAAVAALIRAGSP